MKSKKINFKVAPYSFMTARAGGPSFSNLCALTRKRKFFLTPYDDRMIAKTAKSTVVFLAFASVNFCTFWDTDAAFKTSFFEENLPEQYSLMPKNKKSRDIRETVWAILHFFHCKMLVSKSLSKDRKV